ncbi:hypothetical protein GUITHDRAFT_48895, partial [Guillardia theta CCMP2712]
SLRRRGPDGWGSRELRGGRITLLAAVLHLRGREMCEQPAGQIGGDVLCWNGEVFGGMEVKEHTSDTPVVLDQFSRACAAGGGGGEHFLQAVSRIEGPFAFIFWEERAKRLWFGRDRLGRRSLLMRRIDGGGYQLSSCAGNIQEKGWEEVTPDGIFFLQLHDEGGEQERFELHKTQWPPRVPPLHRSCYISATSPTMSMEEAAQALFLLLDRSVRRRVEGVRRLAGSGMEDGSPVAVMFSGGLDSTLLAALAHRHVDPSMAIDLINVSFDPFEAPDRYTGVESLRELRELFPGRRWNLVVVDVTQEEVEERREEILSLIFPRATQMDFNIGSALWFGSRAAGVVLDDPKEDAGEELSGRPFVSRSSVLLLGMGADEQLCGYSRYRAKMKRGGEEGVLQEMGRDMERIWQRNLGRDDRCISYHGREARFPFLDEEVVSFLSSLPLSAIADMSLPPGIGDKLLLRLVAERVGLRRGAQEVKRAIQFGTRIAKQSNRL